MPQISEHWPKKIPGLLIIISIWFRRPGIASTFNPKEGIAHEWITSEDDTKIRRGKFKGINILLSTLNNFKFFVDELVIIKYMSILYIMLEGTISFCNVEDQNHWWAITFNLKL